MSRYDAVFRLMWTLLNVLLDVARLMTLGVRSCAALKAENLFLRKQLAPYQERQIRPRRASNATKLTLVLLSKLLAWKDALTIVKADTFIRWHRQAFRLFWGWKSNSHRTTSAPGRSSEINRGDVKEQSDLG